MSPIGFVGEHDVVVVGGGPAGVAASVAAARNGAKTLLVEREGFLGGLMTTGLPLLTFHDAHGNQVIKGIAEELVERLAKIGGTRGHIDVKETEPRLPKTATPVDVELLKRVVFEIISDSGVQLLLYTFAVDAILQNSRIKGIVVENKSGRQLILSQVVIDATGDGDIAARAGAPFKKGRTADGLMQPPSLTFRLGGVDLEKAKTVGPEQLHELASQARERGELPESVAAVWKVANPHGDVVVNLTRVIGIDGTKAEDLTRAEIEARKQIVMGLAFLRKYVPGFESAYPVETGPMMGVRETRRILGEYTLTKDDVLQERKFSDGIAQGSYVIDIHNPTGTGITLTPLSHGGSYDIPYRCLVPRKVENLLVAGRCISTSHEAHGSTRVMVCCMATGQAAGTAAALSLTTGVTVRNLDLARLRTTLTAQNCLL